MAYAPIGDPARYHADIRRGDTVSVLPAYTTAGYLPCTAIKKGYFNKEAILDWLIDQLTLYESGSKQTPKPERSFLGVATILSRESG